MTSNSQITPQPQQSQTTTKQLGSAYASALPTEAEKPEKVLCPHCLRTANNGIKCKGICVADSDY
jgi:hypothetical protein